MPAYLEKYFWDIDFQSLNPVADDEYITARLLEYGDVDAVRWLLKKMKKSQLKKAVETSRKLSSRTANFWSLMLDINRSKIACLKKSYQKMQRTHWRS